VARRYRPATVPLGGRVLALRRHALALEAGSRHRAPQRQGLNAVGHDARCTFLENFESIIYFRKS
jgi:hypothetical protein